MRRWLWDNLESLSFSFLRALSVWMAGVSSTDPIDEKEFPSSIPIRYTDPAQGLILVGNPPGEARLTLRAPTSVWEDLTASALELVADLAQLDAGAPGVPLGGG